MKLHRTSLIFTLLLSILILAACSGNQTTPLAQETSPPEPPPQEPTSTQQLPEPEEANSPPTSTPETVFIHLTQPAEFRLGILQRVFDCDTSVRANSGLPLLLSQTCDRWSENYLERPMTAEEETYLPELDILKVEFGKDDSWYYARIYTKTLNSEEVILSGVYFLELDQDIDGRGDFLLLVSNPAQIEGNEWSVLGVQAWQDQNDDVGGLTAVLADETYNGDGYEMLVFDQGTGSDPDLAWARIAVDELGVVELAFKPKLIDSIEPFAWWAWSMKGDLDAGRFDLVDTYDETTTFALDNTCGWIYGSTGATLPNQCTLILPPTVEPSTKVCQPPSGGCQISPGVTDPCYVWDQGSCSCMWDVACIN